MARETGLELEEARATLSAVLGMHGMPNPCADRYEPTETRLLQEVHRLSVAMRTEQVAHLEKVSAIWREAAAAIDDYRYI